MNLEAQKQMMQPVSLARSGELKITRPSLRVGVLSRQPDSYVKDQIGLLDECLSLKCLTFHEKSYKYRFVIEKDGDEYDALGLTLSDLVMLLASRSSDRDEKRDPKSLLKVLETHVVAVDETKNSFVDWYYRTGDADLYNQVQQLVDSNKYAYNAGVILGHQPIVGYLFCLAVYKEKLKTAAAIYKYIADGALGGVKLVYDYIVTAAAACMLDDNKLQASQDQVDKINVKLKGTGISFASNVFEKAVLDVIHENVFNVNQNKLIERFKTDTKIDITDQETASLINYIKNSKVAITDYNATYFLSIALNQLRNTGISYSADGATVLASNDFAVDYYDDEAGTLEIVRENIAAAAQMYYVMTLGDELEIFNVINRIITSYLSGPQVDIRSRELLNDLQMYVFNDSFRDEGGVIYKRTHPEERRMFYQQVFNAGNGETMGGMVINGDFDRLLKKLLDEYVRYMDKVQGSDNPDPYVSRSGIIQAIEDLQYNLSTHCTGMAKVASPIINKELNFVVGRFLKNDELIKQLALGGSTTFWKVVERVLADLRKAIPNVSALRSKAYYGHKLILAIGEFSEGDFEDNDKFSAFISAVDAFIVANSQLEEVPAAAPPGFLPGVGQAPLPTIPGVPRGNEWNY